jgi:hypothetical protein
MSEEQKTQEGQQEGGAADKKKKVNKLTAQALADQIKALEEKNQTTSRYYRHLLQRKKELDGV